MFSACFTAAFATEESRVDVRARDERAERDERRS